MSAPLPIAPHPNALARQAAKANSSSSMSLPQSSSFRKSPSSSIFSYLSASPTYKGNPLALSFQPPTRPASHPLILLNPFNCVPADTPELGTTPLSPTFSEDLEVPMRKIEPYVQLKQMGGLFILPEDARALGLKPIGEADTCYGSVQRYSRVVAVLFGRQNTLHNVFELPAAFAKTQYSGGIIGLDSLWTLGVTVLQDRGMVYLQDPELTPYDTTASAAQV